MPFSLIPQFRSKMCFTSLGPIEISFLNLENYYSYKLVQLFESIVMGKGGKYVY